MHLGISHRDAQGFVPAIRERSEARVQRGAEIGDEIGQRVPEVLVLAPAETMPRHDDVAAKPTVILVQASDGPAFVGGQDLLDHRPPVGIEVGGRARPRKGRHSVANRGRVHGL